MRSKQAGTSPNLAASQRIPVNNKAAYKGTAAVKKEGGGGARAMDTKKTETYMTWKAGAKRG